MENKNNEINLRNLIQLSNNSDISIFNKNKKLKNPEKIIKECEKTKKKELKNSSIMLSNLAKLNSKDTNDLKQIKNIYDNLENKITKIDSILDVAKKIHETEYIECFSNCD